MTGLITEIQKGSTHDGNGIRTVVFMKGCNMRCVWCHNPEAVFNKTETLLAPEKCIGCGCCDKGCFSGAKVVCGETVSVQHIINIAKEDIAYYKDGGGITISGGEPLCQSEFVAEVLAQCKKAGINTAVETNLNADTHTVLKVCGKADMIMCDLKIYTPEKHCSFTGTDNDKILKNIKEIDVLNIPILIRTPVIPSINADEQEIEQIADYIKNMKNLVGYELLSYHPLGTSKPLSQYFSTNQYQTPTAQQMRALAKAASVKGLQVLINGTKLN